MLNLGLFYLVELSVNILCNKRYKFIDSSQTMSLEIRAIIKGFKYSQKPQITDMSETVSDGIGQSEIVCAESERIRIRKEEEKKENNNKEGNKSPSRKKFVIPTIDELKEYCEEKNYTVDCEAFILHYESNGWLVGKNKMKSWKASLGTWSRNSFNKSEKLNKFTTGGGEIDW